MTRKEIGELLETLVATYPDAFIKDATATMNVWEMMFGQDDAELVYKAARYHMATKNKFPVPADIRKAMRFAAMYDSQDTTQLSIKAVSDAKDWTTGCEICPYQDLCDKKVCKV